MCVCVCVFSQLRDINHAHEIIRKTEMEIESKLQELAKLRKEEEAKVKKWQVRVCVCCICVCVLCGALSHLNCGAKPSGPSNLGSELSNSAGCMDVQARGYLSVNAHPAMCVCVCLQSEIDHLHHKASQLSGGEVAMVDRTELEGHTADEFMLEVRTYIHTKTNTLTHTYTHIHTYTAP